MAKHDVLNVSYMRKDSQFLADGIWYVTTPCEVCGIVDEEVPWEQAKTPHHAGLVADQRHAECSRITDEKTVAEAGKAEVAAAERLRDQQKENLRTAQERAKTARETAKTQPKVRLAQVALDAAEENLHRHEHAMGEAERRVVETRKANTR